MSALTAGRIQRSGDAGEQPARRVSCSSAVASRRAAPRRSMIMARKRIYLPRTRHRRGSRAGARGGGEPASLILGRTVFTEPKIGRWRSDDSHVCGGEGSAWLAAAMTRGLVMRSVRPERAPAQLGAAARSVALAVRKALSAALRLRPEPGRNLCRTAPAATQPGRDRRPARNRTATRADSPNMAWMRYREASLQKSVPSRRSHFAPPRTTRRSSMRRHLTQTGVGPLDAIVRARRGILCPAGRRSSSEAIISQHPGYRR